MKVGGELPHHSLGGETMLLEVVGRDMAVMKLQRFLSGHIESSRKLGGCRSASFI